MTAFGILVALLLVGGFRLGDYLDKRAATTPLFTLLIPFMAMVAVFVNFYAWYQRFQEKYENDEGTDGEKPGSESGRHG